MTTEAKRCALYARISPTPEKEVGANYSIASQLYEMGECAKKRGYPNNPALHFVDDNFTGTTLDRPALNRLRDLVRARAIDVLLVYSLDRLVRGLALQLVLKDECDRHGVTLEFVRDHFESTPEGKMMFSFQGVINEYEREKFRERSERGRREKARQGFINSGAVPFGYRYVGKKQGSRGTMIIHEAEAATVREVFAWAVGGMTMYQIAYALNAAGTRSARGGLWSRTTVFQLLRNETYAGRACLGKRTKNPQIIACPRIVEEQTFAAVAMKLAYNRKARVGRSSRKYLLRGKLFCRQCGKRCTTFPGKGSSAYYRCNNADRFTHKQICPAPSVVKERIEGAVWSALWKAISDPAALTHFARAYHARKAVPGRAKRDLGKRIAYLEQKERRAIEIMKEGVIDFAEARRDLALVRAELQAAQGERSAEVVSMPEDAVIAAYAREVAAQGEPVTYDDRRAIVENTVVQLRYSENEVEMDCRVVLSGAGEKNCYSGVRADAQRQ
jgi:site-specific DNA recombinase